MKIEKYVKEYRNTGLCVIKDFIDETSIKDLVEESLLLWKNQKFLTANNLRVGIRKDISGNNTLERLDPVSDISKVFFDLNHNEKIISLAQLLLESEVSILKEKLIYKWPNTAGYGLHADGPYFSVNEIPYEEIVSIAIALDVIDDSNGAIKYYPQIKNKKLKPAVDEPRDIDTCEIKDIDAVSPSLNRGDIVCFDGMVPHCSDFNTSNRARKIYMITFVPSKYKNSRELYYQRRFKQETEKRVSDYSGDFFIN